MQVGRSRSWDSKWSKINDRPRINVWPAWLWSACSWRTVSEGKRIQHMIYRNAVLKNNEQQLKRWSSKCHSPPHCNILILSSAVSISHRFHLVWTGTIRRLWWSPGCGCFCNHVKRQSLTRMCDLVPSSEEPSGAGGVCLTAPHRSCSQADSHGGCTPAPHPSPAESRGVFGHVWKTHHTSFRRAQRNTGSGALYLSVLWYITIFNTIITSQHSRAAEAVPSYVWEIEAEPKA